VLYDRQSTTEGTHVTQPRRHRRHWTAQELVQLRALCDGHASAEDVAEALDRSEGSVIRRAQQLGLPLHDPAAALLPQLDVDSAFVEPDVNSNTRRRQPL
jgi:hypothetical protein